MARTKLNSFYTNSGLFGVLSLAGAALNYALYPALSHVLTPTDFGNFTLILALSNQILAILLAFNITSIYLVKNNTEDVAREKAQAIQKMLIWFFLAATGIVLLLSPILKAQLQINNPMSFLVLSLMLVSTVPAVVWTGYLQGHKKLVKVGLYTFSGSFLKFLLAILFGLIWGVNGALWGVLLGTVGGILILKLSANIKLPRVVDSLSRLTPQQKIILKDLKLYIVEAIIVVGGLGFLQNIDIIFAKAFFEPSVAGVYSGISILSNALYYIAFLLVWIILPEIEPGDALINRRVIATAYKFLACLGLLALAIEFIFRNMITNTLLGHKFAGQGSVLFFATLFQLSLVAIVIYSFYLLVIRSARSLLLGLAVIIPCLILPWWFHDSTKQLITTLWLSVLIGAAVYCIISRVIKQDKNV